jgi:hypothetical protein
VSVEEPKPARHWLGWTILGVWVTTALAVLIAHHIHPATTTQVSLSVREFSFRTNATHILGPNDDEQLLISGLGSLDVQLNDEQGVTFDGSPVKTSSVQIDGDHSASCAFYRVRSSGLDLAGPSILTLEAPNKVGTQAFDLKVHGALSGHLTGRPAVGGLRSGFECTRVHIAGGPIGTVAATFSAQGGESIYLSTLSDTQLSFELADHSEVGDTQIPITHEIRFSHIDPRTSEEKTVLLKGKNEVSFEGLGTSVPVDENDILVVAPKNEFYLSRFVVSDGVQISLHGVAREVRAGPGSSALETLMPSSLDHLDNMKKIYCIVPSIAALILGMLEKLGLLRQK